MHAAAHHILVLLTAALVSVVAPTASAQQYLRIDAGWSLAEDAEVRDNAPDTQRIICGDSTCASAGSLDDIGSGYIAGIGIGKYVYPNVRAEVAYTYRGGYELSQSDRRVPTQSFRADIESHVVMANVLYDVPVRLFGIGPYIGGGIGYALNKTGEVELTSASAPNAPTTLPGGSTTEFAWQLMTGVSVDVTRALTLEFGYRYVDLGAIEFDRGNQIQSGSVAGTTLGWNGSLSAHEFLASIRIGL